MRSLGVAALTLTLGLTMLVAQSESIRERARVQNKLGWEDMRAEAWERAARSFRAAIEIDPQFEIPYYGVGRAQMALKNFTAAIMAYEHCRDLYRAQASRQFTNVQEAQRFRRDRIIEIDEQLRQVQSMRQTSQTADLIRQLQNQRRDIQESIQRGDNMSLESNVPAFVSLALGSAYFRAGRLSDAEREYKATIDSDNRSGEAHSNLAVVYLETERFDLALRSLDAAKKTGFRVNPELEKAIRSRAKR
jgi:tetratricopeptide (TPR) repeat protein